MKIRWKPLLKEVALTLTAPIWIGPAAILFLVCSAILAFVDTFVEKS